MNYNLRVNVYLTPERGGGSLELSETQTIQLTTLSDAAEVLVKLHEFFEVLKTKAAQQPKGMSR